jgi:hypothetical protein
MFQQQKFDGYVTIHVECAQISYGGYLIPHDKDFRNICTFRMSRSDSQDCQVPYNNSSRLFEALM